MSPVSDRRAQVRRSALWAAYGDALGFITEGVDTNGVRRRVGQEQVRGTVPWKRRIGGKFGPTVELPAGCVSDDTQLRLATSRSIRPQAFDVETFAKIELTVWPAYALGAGKGSQEAAASLRRRDVTWATNFFSANRASYLDGGGNGAAMRIQPHVWATGAGHDPRRLIADVVRNAVATHGHPRGILGAVFHARCLQHALERREVPGPAVWDELATELGEIGAIAENDELLGELWLGQWELHSQKRFASEVRVVAKEVQSDLRRCRKAATLFDAVNLLEASRPEQRGSGTKTAILAAIAAVQYADRPLDAVLACANLLRTDTDTIGTMTGALVGAVANSEPDGEIADRRYILHEADRMWAISENRAATPFPYPNLLGWSAPKSSSDCAGVSEEGLEMAGLGPVTPGEEAGMTSGKTPAVWQWLGMWFGQRVLAKRRPHPSALPSSQRVHPAREYLGEPVGEAAPKSQDSEPVTLTLPLEFPVDSQSRDSTGPTLHELTNRVIASNFDPKLVGEALLELTERPDAVEASIAYASIIAKARLSRLERDRRDSNGQTGSGSIA